MSPPTREFRALRNRRRIVPVMALLAILLMVVSGLGCPVWAAQDRTWPVASTNLELDETLVAQGAGLYDYLIGGLSGGEPLYLKNLLASPEEAFGFTLLVPYDAALFLDQAGQEVEVSGFLLHPTSADNDRPDYALPGSDTVLPRMSRAGQEDLWPDDGGPWPLLVYSHGLSIFPGEAGELDFLAELASQGYIVLCLFHGDGRFAPDYKTKHPLQLALRTATLKQALDRLEADPLWAPRIDWSRVGGLGVSYGGTSMLAWSGAGVIELETGLVTPILSDPRLKASAGVVTFSGSPLLPVFGRSLEGGETLSAPQMIICGDGDLIAPCGYSRALLKNSTWRNYLVTLLDQDHFVGEAIQKDAEDWLSVYFAAFIKNDREALEILHTRTSNPGGGDDLLEIVDPPHNIPGD